MLGTLIIVAALPTRSPQHALSEPLQQFVTLLQHRLEAKRQAHLPPAPSISACKAECEKFASCKAIIFRKNVQCTPIARPYESAYESSTTQQVANYLC